MIRLFNVVGALTPGVTIEQARGELEAIRARIAEEHPNPYLHGRSRCLLRAGTQGGACRSRNDAPLQLAHCADESQQNTAPRQLPAVPYGARA